jgi:hypothetical protein
MHTRISKTSFSWSSPAPVAPGMTGFVHVAIASGP